MEAEIPWHLDGSDATVNTANMKTTFDLPEPLLRRAKAAAAHQGRPLRDLVAEAIDAKLAADRVAARAVSKQSNEWDAFKAQLIQQPDGSWFNPNGIDDEGFFEALEEVRHERLMQQSPRESIAGLPSGPLPNKPAAQRRRKPA